MKYLVVVLVAGAIGTAQAQEGVVTYQSVLRMDLSQFPPEIKKMIPPERKSTNELLFSSSEALYRATQEEEDLNREVTAGNRRIQVKVAGDDNNVYYTNLDKGYSVDKTEFFGRIFLIEGDEPQGWKITSDVQQILGYQCTKATAVRDTTVIDAWFTPQIPVSAGPAEYRGLPGLILQVDVDGGRRTYTATNIDERALASNEVIEVPSKGKKVTRKKFEQIRMEKLKEMEEMNGGRGLMIRHN